MNRYGLWVNIAALKAKHYDVLPNTDDAPLCAPPEDSEDGSMHWVAFPKGQNDGEKHPAVWEWYSAQNCWLPPIGIFVTPEAATQAGHRYLGPATCPYELGES